MIMINDFNERDYERKTIDNVFRNIMEGLPEDIGMLISGLLETELFGGFNDGYSATDILGNFNGAGKIRCSSSSCGDYNLFPCNRKGPVRDLFLCICGGKTTLTKAMQEIVKYCRLTEKYMKLERKKSVVLLTDKWNPEQFAKYSAEIKDFCLGENIDFYFFLVTDYGASKLAYVDMYGSNHFAKEYSFFTGVPSKYELALEEIGKYAVFNEGDGEYRIDFENKTLKCDGQVVCDYIPKYILAEFVFDVKRYKNWLGDGASAAKAADIYLFGTHIFADTEVGVGADLCNIFKRLIDRCLK